MFFKVKNQDFLVSNTSNEFQQNQDDKVIL